jgi:geranylgeranyl pyrophosphate synthase
VERCRLKTASLFEASCGLGALFGGRPELAEPLGGFGERLGIAFQMLDDVLDVSGPPERTGKPRGADLLDGTVTLPLILARRHDPSLTGSVRCAEEAVAVCDRIMSTGAIERAREKALGYVQDAKSILGTVDMSPQRTDALRLVADGVVERYA